MRLSIVQNKRIIIVNTLYLSVKSAENNSCFIHNSRHRFTLNRERLERYIYC